METIGTVGRDRAGQFYWRCWKCDVRIEDIMVHIPYYLTLAPKDINKADLGMSQQMYGQINVCADCGGF